jgi:hypothetical protein
MSLGPIDICFSCNIGECDKCDGYTIMKHVCQHGCSVKEFVDKPAHVAYLYLWEFYDEIDDDQHRLEKLTQDYFDVMQKAPGSSHNHQAWQGGYLHHVMECLNIGAQLYNTLNQLRPLPFTRKDALVVMFLHDIEKPFKDSPTMVSPLGKSWNEYCEWAQATVLAPWNSFDWKMVRRQFRKDIINRLGIELTKEQWAALEYVEGEREDYTPGKRLMNELCAFCHCIDVLSARLWHDKGKEQKWQQL